jgi:hypothetical protein
MEGVENNNESNDLILHPAKVEATDMHVGPAVVTDVKNDGRYYLVPINANGDEIGQEFSVSRSSYVRFFSDKTKFKVKKNPQK